MTEFRNTEPLLNLPNISVTDSNKEQRRVKITNEGETTLSLFGFQGRRLIRQFVEHYYVDHWDSNSSIPLGSIASNGGDDSRTPLNKILIKPNETIEVDVWFDRNPQRRERILTMFAEEGTNRKDLVVLAIMPPISE